MRHRAPRERGQTAVEFGIIGIALMLLTVGLVDVGRAAYEYNELSALARYGARWASVVGGTCALREAKSTTDWCNQFGAQSTNRFWTQNGNIPFAALQSGLPCPAFQSNSSNTAPADYYTVQTYSGTPTIVGAIAQKYDTSSSSPNLVNGLAALGLDKSKLFVCISTTNNFSSATQSEPAEGDAVTVRIGYKFIAASGLFGEQLTVDLSASSTYGME
jgi:Flp pilus assembly protein TadG